MNFRLTHFVMTVLALAATVFAQPYGGYGGSTASGSKATAQRSGGIVDMATLQVVEGKIASIQTGLGVQYPTIVVNEKQIRIAPAWFMLDNDFELATGDFVSVKAAASSIAGNSYLYAVEITRSGLTLTLRDTAGVPLWTGGANGRNGRNGNVNAPRTGTGCVAAETIKTVSGTITALTAGAGIQQPVLDLKLADGALLTVKLGPERILLGADLELAVGTQATIRYGVAACTGENIALEITDANGATLKLRDDDGSPVWN